MFSTYLLFLIILFLTISCEKKNIPFSNTNTNTNNPFKYSGYYNVNKTYDTNLYYVFFPNEKYDVPFVLWLNGGPGSSSVGYGMFNENGPWRVNDDLELEKNDETWVKEAHMLYVDQPAGTGFSYTNDDGYVDNVFESSEELYKMLLQFFEDFSEYAKNDFYIFAESYGGHYGPGIAYKIKNDGFKINLKGLAIADGWVDPVNQIPFYGESGYQFGVIDEIQRDYFREEQKLCVEYINKKEWYKAFDTWNTLCFKYFDEVTGGINVYDVRKLASDDDFTNTEKYVAKPEVKELMHTVGHVFNFSSQIVFNNFAKYDIANSVAFMVEDLLNYQERVIKVLVYVGQFDWIIPTASVDSWLRKLNWYGKIEFNKKERTVWKVDGKNAGFYKSYKNLLEYVVRNAGHFVPKDQPRNSLDLIQKFFDYQP